MKKSAPAPRGRPRGFDPEAALDVAMRLFWEKGYDATSISDLTEAMGIGAPSLYAAFGSKDELYQKALESYGSRYGGIVWDDFHAANTARDAVKAYLVNSTSALTGCILDFPRGCMATLARVDGAGGASSQEPRTRPREARGAHRASGRRGRAPRGRGRPARDLHADGPERHVRPRAGRCDPRRARGGGGGRAGGLGRYRSAGSIAIRARIRGSSSGSRSAKTASHGMTCTLRTSPRSRTSSSSYTP